MGGKPKGNMRGQSIEKTRGSIPMTSNSMKKENGNMRHMSKLKINHEHG